MKLRPAYITIEDGDGNIIERIPMTAAAKIKHHLTLTA